MNWYYLFLLLCFLVGFFGWCYGEIIVRKDKKYLATFGLGIIFGVCCLLTGLGFHFAIMSGVKIWSMEVTGPYDKIGTTLTDIISKGSYNLVYSLFGAYTNIVCSIFLIATPFIAISGIFLKKK